MTLAAAFIHDSGILLCSDTQMETGTSKSHAPKIGKFEYPGGKIAIAFAGNANNARTTIEKCARVIGKMGEDADVLGEIESIIDAQYRRLVYRHPKYGKAEEFNLHYWLTFAWWRKRDSKTYLLANDQVNFNWAAVRCHCTGIGKDLADYLAEPLFEGNSPTLTEESAFILGAYVLARVKDAVPAVGGASQFLSVRNTGEFSEDVEIVLYDLERIAKSFEVESRKLLFTMAADKQEDFEGQLRGFSLTAEKMRSYWSAMKGSKSAIARFLESSRRARQARRPSQE
jgi:hypothetical protein